MIRQVTLWEDESGELHTTRVAAENAETILAGRRAVKDATRPLLNALTISPTSPLAAQITALATAGWKFTPPER